MAGKSSDADLLALPQIPKPKQDDPEDVAWALSTAEAMWSRAENADAIKWIRRAAEAASDAEADDRALELAKAAADLASLLAPLNAKPEEPVTNEPVDAARPTAPAPLVATAPAPPPSSPARPVTSSPPKAPAPSRTAPPEPSLPKVTHSRAGERRRRSSHNLSDEAKRAGAQDVALRAGGDQELTKVIAAPSSKRQLGTGEARRRRSRPATEEMPPEPSPREEDKFDTGRPPAPVPEAQGTSPRRLAHADEIDQWPTQSLQHDELGGSDEQHTRIGVPAYTGNPRRPAEDLRASQAVRVVVWRGPDGVHVAPAGTTVSAITVDALLVALDPGADLAAWLKG